MMIGNGTPSSQSSAPLPKPMCSSIVLVDGRRAAKAKVPAVPCSIDALFPKNLGAHRIMGSRQVFGRTTFADNPGERLGSHQLNGHDGGVGLSAKRTGGGRLGALRAVRTRGFGFATGWSEGLAWASASSGGFAGAASTAAGVTGAEGATNGCIAVSNSIFCGHLWSE
jgi:hypothetical protein